MYYTWSPSLMDSDLDLASWPQLPFGSGALLELSEGTDFRNDQEQEMG